MSANFSYSLWHFCRNLSDLISADQSTQRYCTFWNCICCQTTPHSDTCPSTTGEISEFLACASLNIWSDHSFWHYLILCAIYAAKFSDHLDNCRFLLSPIQISHRMLAIKGIPSCNLKFDLTRGHALCTVYNYTQYLNFVILIQAKCTTATLVVPLLTAVVPIILAGFAGYFDSVLYKDVHLGIEPNTATPNMFSW